MRPQHRRKVLCHQTCRGSALHSLHSLILAAQRHEGFHISLIALRILVIAHLRVGNTVEAVDRVSVPAAPLQDFRLHGKIIVEVLQLLRGIHFLPVAIEVIALRGLGYHFPRHLLGNVDIASRVNGSLHDVEHHCVSIQVNQHVETHLFHHLLQSVVHFLLIEEPAVGVVEVDIDISLVIRMRDVLAYRKGFAEGLGFLDVSLRV